MIIDDKTIMLPPPPPYLSQSTPGLTPLPILSTSGQPTLTSLPAHILLQIIYNTFPPPNSHSTPLLHRRILFWLSTSLRLTSRHLYTACMHILRSTYLHSYQSLVRPPYTSDPFPLASESRPPAYTSPSPSPTQRETPILDLYIALKIRQDVFSDDTSLHIEREEAFRDLFDVAQPRARLEDLVREYGIREGVVCVSGYTKESDYRSLVRRDTGVGESKTSEQDARSESTPSKVSKTTPSRWFHSFSLSKKSSPSPSPPIPSPSLSPPTPSHQQNPNPTPTPLPFSTLSISFSPRQIGLIHNRSRTIAHIPRAPTPAGRREETLERLAGRLVREVGGWLEGR